ncbi:MAG: hypothetical protein JW888_09205 [Pirellulales bacterium]|nr:hypothetical protein [Pirellulales bacterium]
MWQCVKCREQIEDAFNVCWRCGTSKEGVEDPDFRGVDNAFSEQSEAPSETRATTDQAAENHPLSCPRCRCMLDYIGTKAFHEGKRWGVLGDLGELFVNKERFDVYCCPNCGRVEFFVDGIGEEFRPH